MIEELNHTPTPYENPLQYFYHRQAQIYQNKRLISEKCPLPKNETLPGSFVQEDREFNAELEIDEKLKTEPVRCSINRSMGYRKRSVENLTQELQNDDRFNQVFEEIDSIPNSSKHDYASHFGVNLNNDYLSLNRIQVKTKKGILRENRDRKKKRDNCLVIGLEASARKKNTWRARDSGVKLEDVLYGNGSSAEDSTGIMDPFSGSKNSDQIMEDQYLKYSSSFILPNKPIKKSPSHKRSTSMRTKVLEEEDENSTKSPFLFLPKLKTISKYYHQIKGRPPAASRLQKEAMKNYIKEYSGDQLLKEKKKVKKLLSDPAKMLRNWKKEYYLNRLDQLQKADGLENGIQVDRPSKMRSFKFEIADDPDPTKVKDLELINIKDLEKLVLPENVREKSKKLIEYSLLKKLAAIRDKMEIEKSHEKVIEIRKEAKRHLIGTDVRKSATSLKEMVKQKWNRVRKALLQYLHLRINLNSESLINPTPADIEFYSSYHLENIRKAFLMVKTGDAQSLRILLRKERNYVFQKDSVRLLYNQRNIGPYFIGHAKEGICHVVK